MKLYEYRQAPNPRRVRMFLTEKGIDVSAIEHVQVDIMDGANLGEAFTAKNPMARIPMLELDDGTCISESVSISRYFELQQPEPVLFGRSAMEQVQVDMWNRRMELGLMQPVVMAFRHLSGQFADRETVVEAWGEASWSEAERMFAFLDRHLANNTYIAGDAFSIADITALCAVDFARVIKLRIDTDQINLKRWHDSVSARPSASA